MSISLSTPLPLRRRKPAWMRQSFIYGYGLVILFIMAVATLVLMHGGSVLQYAYPLGALLLGLFLYLYRRGVYIAFVWWTWLFTPEVRRLVDFQTAFHSLSVVMLTPLLVTLLSFIHVAQRPKQMLKRKMLPFLLLGLTLLYGLLIGFVVSGPAAALYDFVSWFAPLCFGAYLLLDSERFAENRQAFVLANMIGLLVTAAYGLYQFYHFPPWDAFWLANANFASAGQGLAEDVRLFGPLNSPLPFGIALMVPLVLALVTKGPVRIVAAFLGFPAFGLSLVRFAWLGWVLGVGFLLARMGGKLRIRIIVTSLIVAVLAAPLITVGPVASSLSKRLATFSNLRQDASLQAREGLYETVAGEAISQPIGLGLGANSAGSKLSAAGGGGFDSGVLLIPLVFGWIGTITIVWSLGTLAMRALFAGRRTGDNISLAAGGIFAAMILQILGTNSLVGFLGVATWTSAVIASRGRV